jgi:transcriptional regulator with XRE-family HTH domain
MANSSLQARLAKAIRARREAIKVSQEDFADLIGVHRTYYGAVERGKQNLTLTSIEKIAAGLGVEVSALFISADKLELDVTPPRPNDGFRPLESDRS